MVVVTLSTALVFSLVVFPALCYTVDLKDPDMGSVAALIRGDWRQFLGWTSGTSGFTVLPDLPEDEQEFDVESGAPAELVTDADEGSSSCSHGFSGSMQKDVPELDVTTDQQ